MNAIRRAGLCAALPLGLVTGPRLWAGAPSVAVPSPRFAHALAYDAARERVVLFGGTTGSVGKAAMLADTWEWDGRRWRRVDVPGPEPRAYAAMAFDPARKVVVLNGGRTDRNTTLADTWEYDGKAWTRVVEKGPIGRDHHSLVYDPVNRVLLTFGGWDGAATRDDLWRWDGKAWLLISEGGPASRSAYGMAWDDDRATVLLYGGTNVDARHADLWEWDGRRWQVLTDPYANPNRNHFTMHYDPARRRVLAFGGLDRRHQATDSMLVLHGNRFHPWEGDRPAPRFNHALVRLGSGSLALLFGGCTRPGDDYVPLDDTWLWDGETWRRLDGRAAATRP